MVRGLLFEATEDQRRARALDSKRTPLIGEPPPLHVKPLLHNKLR
jgi:hypothetical protein